MKKIIIFLFGLNMLGFSQSVEVTAISKGPGMLTIEPGIATNQFVQQEGNIYTYNLEFDQEGKFIGNTAFNLEISDRPMKNGFIGYIDKPKKGGAKGWHYIPYASPDQAKPIDLVSLVGNSGGKSRGFQSMRFQADYCVARVDNTFYTISEDLKVINSYAGNSSMVNYDGADPIKQVEVLQDGCIYVIYETKTGFKVEKVDIANQTQSVIEIPLPKGMDWLAAFPYRYNDGMTSPDSYYLSINQNGSKVFFGFCPGKKYNGYSVDDAPYVKSQEAYFYVLNGKDLTIESQYTCKFSDEHLEAYDNSKEGLRNTYIEDVCFFNEDIYVVLSSIGQNGLVNGTLNDGQNPQAIYKISSTDKKVSLHGLVINRNESVVTKKRDHGKIIVKDDKMFLVYPTQVKEKSKTFQVMNIVDITDKEFKAEMVKEGFENFDPAYQSHINIVAGTSLSDGSLLYLAYNIGGMNANTFTITHVIKVKVN